MNRPSFPVYYMALAFTVAQRSSCQKRKVGCVLVSAANQVMSTGYNGTLPGSFECSFDTSAECYNHNRQTCMMRHAEVSALAAVTISEVLKGGSAYVTTLPCYNCMYHLIQAGISKVYYPESNYWAKGTDQLSKEVELIQLSFEEIDQALDTLYAAHRALRTLY